eukprot:scaffold322009_cov28-Tisochrysis_lutea.AAC.2
MPTIATRFLPLREPQAPTRHPLSPFASVSGGSAHVLVLGLPREAAAYLSLSTHSRDLSRLVVGH